MALSAALYARLMAAASSRARGRVNRALAWQNIGWRQAANNAYSSGGGINGIAWRANRRRHRGGVKRASS